MFRLGYSLLACAALLGLPQAGAQAAVTNLGVITGAANNDSREWHDTVSGTFTDTATFSTTQSADFSASITNSYADRALFISDLTLSLYTGAGTLIDSVTAADNNVPPGHQEVDLTALGQAAGAYYLTISGTTGDTPTYGGSLSIAISTVPLPASAPLLGGALLVVGAVGWRRRRKDVTA